MKTNVCHACAFDTTEIEFVGRAINERWFCAYSRPEYSRVTDSSECEYYEPINNEDEL